MKKTFYFLVSLLLFVPTLSQAQVWRENTGSLGATGSVALNTRGMGTAGIQLTGTLAGTLSFEVTNDNTNWVAARCTPPGTTTAVTSATAVGLWTCPVAGNQQLRARVSTYTSGTFVITVAAAGTGGGGGSGGGAATASLTLQETDDGSIAGSQTADAVIGLQYLYDGANQVRQRTYLEDSASASGDQLFIPGCVRTATAPTDKSAGNTNGDYEPCQVDANGRQYANSSLYTPLGDSTMNDTVDAVKVVNSTVGDATVYITVRPSDGTSFLSNSDWTVGTAIGTAGPGLMGVYQDFDGAALATMTNVDTELEAVPWSMSIKGVGYTMLVSEDGSLQYGTLTTPMFTTPTPSTTGGWTSLNATAADGATACTSTAQAIKASAGTFGGYFINNPNTADSWLHIYNVAVGSVTVGTTNPALTFRIPGQAANSVAGNLEITNGVNFSTAMAMACTTTAGGNGNPSNAIEADIFYK